MGKIQLGKKEVIHFIGIGGIGMSGLAQIMKIMAFNVQGSDVSQNKNTDNCKKIGIRILKGHKKTNINSATIIVKSSAIKQNNIEILSARKKNIPIYDRIEMLANVIDLKKNIIITGSHGKTTTTSLVAKIISAAKLDPTIINGGVINSIKNNAKFGKGDWAVVEADESDGSFLKVPINYSIVTNIDKEHLDYYKNFENLKKAFIQFIEKTPPIGKAFLCLDNKDLKNLISKVKTKNYYTYGFNKESNYQICSPEYYINYSKFDLKIKKTNSKNRYIKNIYINLIGKHNVVNATAAIALCLNLVLDRKIITIFQPHRYSRIKNLKKEFAKCFSSANQVILCPVYSAGEKKDLKYNSLNFARMITKFSKVQVILIKEQFELNKFLQKNLIKNEIVIGMGAGSISNWMNNLKNVL